MASNHTAVTHSSNHSLQNSSSSGSCPHVPSPEWDSFPRSQSIKCAYVDTQSNSQSNSGIATQLYPTGVKGLQGTKGFIAPEVFSMGGSARYNEKADIFSFGMLLYQIISRKGPYYELSDDKIHLAVQKGERPKLPKDSRATMAYHYLSQVMEACWEGDPQERPHTESILKYICLSSTQSVMSVIHTRRNSSLRQAHVIKTQCHRHNDVWVCSDGNDGLEIDIYSLNTLEKTKTTPLEIPSSVQCASAKIIFGSQPGIFMGVPYPLHLLFPARDPRSGSLPIQRAHI